MKNIVGQIASKGDFYFRKKELARLLRTLDAGANIQLAAPRRVGKSSILYYLKDTPPEGYHFIYIEVESARSKNDFYRKIYKEIIKSDVLTAGKKLWEQIKSTKNHFLRRLKGISLGEVGGIELTELAEIDYEDELLNLLCGFDLNGDKLVIMIDEFPEVILNIVEDAKGDTAEAKNFLQSNRGFRNNAEIRSKVQFIYTGSNSLNVTVAALDCSALINDLNAVPVMPLEAAQAKDLITRVLDNYGYHIEPDQLEYLVIKVEWLIPFYLQLMVQEILNAIEAHDIITKEIIDNSFSKIMEQRNDHHFEHYVKRLKRLFKDAELKFVTIFLNELANKTSISKEEAINIANGMITESQLNQIMNSLTFDGYIIHDEENKNYKFNSPILKMWWYKHEC